MSFTDDIIKRNYVYEGYLPNYPYYLISDKEMCDAFIREGGYFDTNYPRDIVSSDSELSDAYDTLKESISNHIENFLDLSNPIPLPIWVYSYMIGSVISVNSDQKDIHDLLVLLGKDNPEDEFTVQAARQCYEISKAWISKYPTPDDETPRPPTIFGEPIVIKSLRLNSVK